MSGHLHRDAECKCKYCLTYDHVHQQRTSLQRGHNHQHQTHEHLRGGRAASPPGPAVAACGHARGKSPPRFQKSEQPTCCGSVPAKKCNAFEDPMECRKNRFQELRKTWSEFARVCNCPNCKGSLQKERYLDKLAESADRISAFKQQHMNCEDQCCCSESSIASGNQYEHKSPHPASRATDYDYEQQQQEQQEQLLQQRDAYLMQYEHQQNRRIQQQIPPYQCHEVSSDERMVDCPGNVGCKCLTCTCMNSQKANSQKITRQPRCGGSKKEHVKHHYY